MKVLKLILIGVVAVLLGACYQSDKKIKPLSEEETEQIISFYYQNPNVERLAQALATLDEPGSFNSKMKAPLMGFLSGLASQRPQDWQLIKQIVFDNAKELNQVWSSIERQQLALQKMLSQKNIIARSAEELDFLWGAFSATGDTRFVQIIERTAKSSQSDPLVKAAAEWSLSSQRKEHPLVEQTLNKLGYIEVLGKSFKLEETKEHQNGNKQKHYKFVRPDGSEEMFLVSEINVKQGKNKQQVADAYARYLKESGEGVTQFNAKENELSMVYSLWRDGSMGYLSVAKFKDIVPNKVLKNEYTTSFPKQQYNKKYIEQIVNDFTNAPFIGWTH